VVRAAGAISNPKSSDSIIAAAPLGSAGRASVATNVRQAAKVLIVGWHRPCYHSILTTRVTAISVQHIKEPVINQQGIVRLVLNGQGNPMTVLQATCAQLTNPFLRV
jgi:hypothetical protein